MEALAGEAEQRVMVVEKKVELEKQAWEEERRKMQLELEAERDEKARVKLRLADSEMRATELSERVTHGGADYKTLQVNILLNHLSL